VNEGKFVVKKITKLEDVLNGKIIELPESDLTVQSEDLNSIIQFTYIESKNENKNKVPIKEGCYSFITRPTGLGLTSFELRKYKLLKTIDNTSSILSEANKFFSNLNVYKKLKIPPKRALLLCSPAGVGKSSAINEVCKNLLKQKGTAVIIWDTSSFGANDINQFFLTQSEFHPDVKRFVFVIEDIEGGTFSEDDYGRNARGSSLLNLLDGVGNPFKGVPTFILSTTNNPEKSVGALIDRPGRFDKVVEMKTPNKHECKELLKFILNTKELNKDQESAAELASENEFSIAHLQEAVTRSMLDQITVGEAVGQLVKHKKRFKDAFIKAPKNKMGMI